MQQKPDEYASWPFGANGFGWLPSPLVPGQGFGLPPNGGARATQSDLAYGPRPRQRLDLYLPPGGGEGRAPLLLFVHGGMWSTGDKAPFAWLGAALARQGLVVAVANYRLSPTVQHPAHAQDVAAATAWLARHGAAHGGDPRRLYLAGHSAGAHLTSLVALDPRYLAAEGLAATAVRGVVGIAGAAYDLDARYAATPLAPLFTTVFGPNPWLWAEAAPRRYARPGAPAFLLIHGLNDNQTPATAARAFARTLQQDGVPTEVKLLRDGDHFSVLTWSADYVPRWIASGSPHPAPLDGSTT